MFDKFKIFLTFKLSGLRTKRIYTPFGEIIAGRKRGFSASATCCTNEELTLKRLRFKLQDLNFVVGDSKKEVDFKGKRVIFCTPESFVGFFKENFGFRVDWKDIMEYDITKEFLKGFPDQRKALAILNSMYLLYLYREFPEVFIHTKDTRQRMEIEPDIPMLEEVKNLGYGFSYPKTAHPIVRMNYLTDDGREIARNVLEHKIRNCWSEIESLIEKFGEKKVFFIVMGSLRKDGLFLKVRESSTIFKSSTPETPDILTRLHTSDKSLYKELKDVQTPLQLVSRFITTFAIYDEALNFYDELERLGLALKVRLFSKWGVELGTAYRAPIELAEHLMERCFFDVDSKTLSRFVELLSGLYLKAIEGIAGERMLNELFMGLDMEPVAEKIHSNHASNLEMAELISAILS